MVAVAATRMVFSGFVSIYAFYAGLFCVVLLVRIARDRLSSSLISVVVWACFSFAALASLRQLGLVGHSAPLALIAAIVAAAAFPRREGRLFTALLVLPLVAMYGAAIVGWDVRVADPLRAYVEARTSWVTALVILLATGYFGQYVIRMVLAAGVVGATDAVRGNAVDPLVVLADADALPETSTARAVQRYVRQIAIGTFFVIAAVQALQFGLLGSLDVTDLVLGTVIPLAVAPPVLGWAAWQQRKYVRAFNEVARIRDNVLAAIYDSMATLSLLRDNETGEHLTRCRRYAELMMRAASDLGHAEVRAFDPAVVSTAVRLHDVGKVATPDAILLKPGKLDPEEFAIMQRHAEEGAAMIATFAVRNDLHDDPVLTTAQLIARSHHENWDGSGYPEGLRGDAIPFPARVMAIIDVYDALRSERPYKRGFDHDEALVIMRSMADTKFDPVLFGVFLAVDEGFASIYADARDRAFPPEPGVEAASS